MTLGNRERVAVAAFCDVLLPGGDGWPPASAVIGVDLAECRWLVSRALALADCPAAELPASVARLEIAEPDAFRRTLGAVYEAYYSTAPVREVVRRLAQSGPRDTDPCFDARLTQAVVQKRAGLRRM